AVGIGMLIAFFVIEQRAKEPIVPFKLFKNRAFAVSMVVGFLSALGMFGMIIFVPLETQGVLGVSVTNSGLLLTPMMLGLVAVSDQVSKLNLPAGFTLPSSASASNPNALFDPAAIANTKAKLPPQALPLFDQVLHAIREALAVTLHDIFLVAMILVGLALIASLFMPD